MTTTIEQVSETDGDVMVPRQPTIAFLRSTLEKLAELRAKEDDLKQQHIIESIRYDMRSHLAAFLLAADTEHQAHVASIRARIARGDDLGRSLTLAEFDTEFPEA